MSTRKHLKAVRVNKNTVPSSNEIKGVGEATAPAIAPYLHPCRQQLITIYKVKQFLFVTDPFNI